MKYLKLYESFDNSLDDIRELYIDFRDEWGFTETTNVHNPDDNDCVWRSKNTPQGLFVRMSFTIGNQDVESCYNSLKEMCDRIELIDSGLRIHYVKSYSDLGNLFFSVDIFPRKNNI